MEDTESIRIVIVSSTLCWQNEIMMWNKVFSTYGRLVGYIGICMDRQHVPHGY